jgi:hypothetical protein
MNFLRRSRTRIVTTYWAKPIPTRAFDWSAVRDDYEGGMAIGHGPTRAAAITDLLMQEED